MAVLLRQISRRPSGEFVETRDGRVLAEGQTLSCSHCGAHWQVKPGSGRKRGFCSKCMAPTCGSKNCDTCIPFEKQLEAMEQRRRLHSEMQRQLR